MDYSCITSSHDKNSLKLEDKEITYHQTGEGELLIFLPPPLCDVRIYCKLQQKLSHKYRVVGVDLPEAKSVNSSIKILEKIIRKGTTQPFHLIASSATGWIAQFLAHQFTNQIKSLILFNSFYDNSKYDSKYKLALKSSKLIPGFKFRKEVIKNSKRLIASSNGHRHIRKYFKQRVEKMGKSGVRKQLYWFVANKNPPNQLGIPILAFYSQNDPFITPNDKNNLIKIHDVVTVSEINSSSHFLFLTELEKVFAQIDDFVSSV